jgi:hypothetical protein
MCLSSDDVLSVMLISYTEWALKVKCEITCLHKTWTITKYTCPHCRKLKQKMLIGKQLKF